MKLFFKNVSYFYYKPIEITSSIYEEIINKEGLTLKNCLIIYSTLEKGDIGINNSEENVYYILKLVLKKLKNNNENIENIILFPFAHLSNNLEYPMQGRILFDKIWNYLNLKKEEIKLPLFKAEYGWTKDEISNSERKLDKYYYYEIDFLKNYKEENLEESKDEKNYFIYNKKIKKLEEKELTFFSEEFKKVVKLEIKNLKNLEYNEKFEKEEEKIKLINNQFQLYDIKWESNSDIGNMVYSPKLTNIFNIISNLVRKLVSLDNFNFKEIKGTNMFSLENKDIFENHKNFQNKLYSLKTEKNNLVLRYAACSEVFSYYKNKKLENLPLTSFEIADCYRMEQHGELELLFRLRRFFMPDTHILIKERDVFKKFIKILKKIIKLFNNLFPNLKLYPILNISNLEIINKKFIKEIKKQFNFPLIIKNYNLKDKFYWTYNLEIVYYDEINNKTREVPTIQIDINNSKLFNIKSKDNEFLNILHIAYIGSIERFIYTIFYYFIKNKNAILPFLFSAHKISIILLDDKYLNIAHKIKKIIINKIKNNFILKNNLEEEIYINLIDRNINKSIINSISNKFNYIFSIGEKEKEIIENKGIIYFINEKILIYDLFKKYDGINSKINISIFDLINLIKKDNNKIINYFK